MGQRSGSKNVKAAGCAEGESGAAYPERLFWQQEWCLESTRRMVRFMMKGAPFQRGS